MMREWIDKVDIFMEYDVPAKPTEGFKEYERVSLKRAVGSHAVGEVGTIVDISPKSGVIEVEFSSGDVLSLRSTDIQPV